jgi:hypothetical protein
MGEAEVRELLAVRHLVTDLTHRVDSIEGQRNAISSLRSALTSQPDTFKRVYDFAFVYSKPSEQRSLPLDTAAPLWQLLLPIAPPQLFSVNSAWNSHTNPDAAAAALQRWVDYLTEENKGRAISKDIWSQVRRRPIATWSWLTSSPVPRLCRDDGRRLRRLLGR